MNDLLIFPGKTANFSCELWGEGVIKTVLETERCNTPSRFPSTSQLEKIEVILFAFTLDLWPQYHHLWVNYVDL